jgi:AraC family transcriptional regulator
MSVAFLPTFQTYGRQSHQRDFGGFAISVGVHGPGHRIPAHRHADEYVWCVMLSGALEESSGARREEAQTGSVLIRPPDCVHADRFAAKTGLCLNIFPDRSWLIERDLHGLSDIYLHQRAASFLTLGREIARELTAADSRTSIAIESLLIELLSRTARIHDHEISGKARWLAIVLDEIEANPSGELRLSDLAHHCGVSAGHLARSFRATLGRPLGDYVRERRLARAADLMRSTKLPLADIAVTIGFCDQAHFSRAFKAEFGMPPASYRKQAAS